MNLPFTTCEQMLRYDAGRNTPLWRLAVEYEMARGNLSEAEVIAKMVDLVRHSSPLHSTGHRRNRVR